eukprot:tig00021038_g17590.t1
MEACHEAMGNPAVLHHEAPANELFTRLRMKPELAEKYGTGRAAENSFQALKQVAAVLEQMGSKSDVLTHRMLNGGNDSGEEYPEPDIDVEAYVPPPYTRRNKPLWLGTPERPIPTPILSCLYRRVANTENRYFNALSNTLKAKLHWFPAMSREEGGSRSVRGSIAVVATAIRDARAASPAARAYVEKLARLPPNDAPRRHARPQATSPRPRTRGVHIARFIGSPAAPAAR